MAVIRDFESQNGMPVNGNWNQETNTRDQGTLTDSYETSAPIEGNSSRWLAGDGGGTRYAFTRNGSITPNKLEFLLFGLSRDGWQGDGSFIWLKSGSTRWARMEMTADGGFKVNGNVVSGSWNLNTTYKFRFYNIDFGFQEFWYEFIEESTQTVLSSGSVQFENPASDLDTIEYGMSHGGAGGQVETLYDYFIIPEPPATPSSFRVTDETDTTVDLAWDDVSNEDDYELQRSPDGSSWSTIAILAADTTTYTDTGRTEDTQYYYRLRAANQAGTSNWTQTNTYTDLHISGTVTLGGTAVSGAKVYILDTTNDDLEATTTTDSNGNFGVDVPGNQEYHVAVQYDDGSTKYNAKSKPYLT